MQRAKSYLALAAMLFSGALLGACGNSNVHTSSPSSTLGTDSSATKVGGTANGPATGSTGAGSPSTPAAGADNTTAGGTTGTSQ